MKRKTVIRAFLGLLVLAVVCGSFIHLSKMREPTYQGRTLNNWLDDMTNGMFWVNGSSRRCEEAVRHMGKAGVPFILQRIDRDDSPFNEWLRRTRPKMPPLIQRWVKPPPSAGYYMTGRALQWCGPESVPLLVDGMQNGKPIVREACAEALMRCWKPTLSTNTAFDLFQARLKDDDVMVRVYATFAVQQFHSLAPKAIPELIANLTHSEAGRRAGSRGALHARSADTLGMIGPVARPAIPELMNMLNSTNVDHRLSAAVALWRIESNATSFAIITNELTAIDKNMRWKIFEVLGEMSPRAKDALPILNQWLQTANESERRHISNSIAKLSGSTNVVPVH